MARETTVLPGQDSALLDALGAALQEQAPASLTVGDSSVPLPPELRQVLAGVEAGDFMPIVDAQVPFAEARKAHERLQDRQNFGKVVLVP